MTDLENTPMPVEKKIHAMILADVPLWVFDDSDVYRRSGAYSSWLEALLPYFGEHPNLVVDWVVFSKNIKEPRVLRIHHQNIHILPRWKKVVSMMTGYWLESRRIKVLSKQLQPDMIHAWGTEDVFGIAGSRLDYPKLFSLQGALNDYLKKVGGSWLFRLQAFYEKSTIRRYNYATAESSLARDLILEQNPQCKVDLVDYGVHPSFFEVKWHPAADPQFVFVGTLDERKGIRQLIEAFRHHSLSKIKLVVIGHGSLRDELESMSGSNVEWCGRIPRSEIQTQLSESWGLVMPTFADTGPTVLKEARVVGMPVITTDKAGAKSYLKHGENGFIINAGNVGDIINTVLELSDSRDKCLKFGKEQHVETRRLLHPKVTIDNFVKVYGKTLSNI